MDFRENWKRWVENADEQYQQELADLAEDEKSLEDAFYCDLAFGTAGLRGVIGMGSNRMNVYTVGRATQGLATYLNANFDDPSVAICRDSRNMGEMFVQTASGVLAANGIRSYIYPRIEPTPSLSFAVRDLGCSAGINITASHNRAEYNGYKVYDPTGCQITSDVARQIQEAIDSTDIFDDVKIEPFDKALASGLAQWIPEDTLDRFIEATLAQSLEPEGAGEGGLSIVYTPLNGTGLECVTRILRKIGITDVTVVPEQADPDGNFPTCPYPNPEFREALEKGLELCNEVHPDLLLATDPDADRVGIAVPHDDGYRLLTGNETGVLLLDYVCRMRKEAGQDLSDKIAVTTIVSSTMVDALARDYGFELRRTLTGFKYIGEQIAKLEAVGQQERFIFGFEESYGYLAGTEVRDKDAVVASMLVCQMARWHRSQGRDLVDAMEGLYQRYGYYENRTVSKTFPGAEGSATMKRITSGLRADPPEQIAGLDVEKVVDYAAGTQMPMVNGTGEPQMLPESDVLEFQISGGNKLIVRPSGTEPKIKAYLFAKGSTRGEAEDLLQELEQAADGMLA